jgi:cellulose synthase A
MEANGSLVAGSHNRNELVVIRQDGDGVNAHSLTSSQPHMFCMDLVKNSVVWTRTQTED